MTDMMNVNPLMDFARKTECSVKLPSQGLWYDDDAIEFNAIGEVDIMPMLPNDEIMLVNPESLVSGESIISLIKSCCPGIKRPEELYYPDINVLLLGIKKATYGDEIIQQYVCPKCWEKKNEYENKKIAEKIKEKYDGSRALDENDAKEIREQVEKECAPVITQMEKDGKILITPQDASISIDSILNRITMLPQNAFIETKNGLKIYVTPYKCSDKIRFTNQQIRFQRISKYYEGKNMEIVEKDDFELNDEYLKSLQKLTNMYMDASDLTLDIISYCIKNIVLPNGTIVDKHEYISEFIKNCDVDIANKLQDKINELNNCGAPQTIPLQCTCCGHKWEEKFYGFNQADFFGIGS